MKLSTVTATLLLASAEVFAEGPAETVQLFAESDDKGVDGQFVSSVLEGSGISYLVFGYNPFDYVYKDNRISTENYGMKQEFSIEANHHFFLTINPNPVNVEFNNEGVMSVNGVSDGFYACKNVEDPLEYSKRSRMLMFYHSGDGDHPSETDCAKVRIVKNSGAQTKTPYAVTSTENVAYTYTGTDDLDATTDLVTIDSSDYLTYIPSSVTGLKARVAPSGNAFSGNASGSAMVEKTVGKSSSSQMHSSSSSKGDGTSPVAKSVCTIGFIFAALAMIV
ncbi:unnamed protein product [Ambrosiozyma monospora]|uniref:Unnamed protein product n=1 Tax=Ambrosiozyma monospora TaxID=43982 RepID=A0ACB5SRD1_AMBMO|nr:unnamed protein product [Ambrosiozyma monospora]